MKKCSGIRCPFCRTGEPSECTLVDDCEYFTQQTNYAELLDNLMDMIADRVVEKLRQVKECK